MNGTKPSEMLRTLHSPDYHGKTIDAIDSWLASKKIGGTGGLGRALGRQGAFPFSLFLW